MIEKYGSLDRFYLETDFSKGHPSQILRGKRSPSLATIVKLAKALDIPVADFLTVQTKSRPTARIGVAHVQLAAFFKSLCTAMGREYETSGTSSAGGLGRRTKACASQTAEVC